MVQIILLSATENPTETASVLRFAVMGIITLSLMARCIYLSAVNKKLKESVKNGANELINGAKVINNLVDNTLKQASTTQEGNNSVQNN